MTEQTLDSATEFITFAATLDETAEAMQALFAATGDTAVVRAAGMHKAILLSEGIHTPTLAPAD